MTKEELFAELTRDAPVYAQNPFWKFEDVIKHRVSGTDFSISEYKDLFDVVVKYFKTVYDSFKTEAQVLLVTKEDFAKLESYNLPTIDNPTDLVITVLPQENTWGNTSISEEFWQCHILGNDITPVMRIHSHHILNAYQSTTDWSSLNSGTLEVVLGKIYDDEYKIAYWLDERGKETKDNVWSGNYSNVVMIPNGNPDTIKSGAIVNGLEF